MSVDLAELGLELDSESWEWLSINHPTIADKVQLSVNRGATPDAVRAFVLRRCGVNRVEFARRCEAAARHLESLKGKS
jgi:hypothetical protein